MPRAGAVRFCTSVIAALLAATLAAQGDPKPKLKKPTLSLRATPRMAFSPVTVFLTAELNGGDDVEEYYCPQLEWEWGDGGKSVQEGDCAPFEQGVSKIERRFTTDHEYRRAGVFNISVLLRRTNRAIAKADVRVTIRPGIADPR